MTTVAITGPTGNLGHALIPLLESHNEVTRWFYPREKAQLEQLLHAAARRHPHVELTVLRPTIVVGPQTAATIGDIVPPALRPLARLVRRPLPTLLGDATGTFNLAGEGTVSGEELARELGLTPLPIPPRARRELGWRPNHTSLGALRAAISSTRTNGPRS